MKIVSVIGARPQFVKAAALSKGISETKGLSEVLIHTGQHYDPTLSDIFFTELGIPEPQYNLQVGSASHGEQTANMLVGIEKVLLKEKPDMLLVYGDTNSTVAGALAAKKLKIPVAHVEAGLRSFNEYQPEEINRRVTDHLSNILFATSEVGVKYLQHEGIEHKRIHNVGDIMCDTIAMVRDKLNLQKTMQKYTVEDKGFLLVTVHRAENTDDEHRLRAIFDGLCLLSEEHKVVVPLHPRTVKCLKQIDSFDSYSKKLDIIEPVGFLDMVALTTLSKLVMTDSGGLQKESFYCGTPCVILRDETEWGELVSLGCNSLLPPRSSDEIFTETISSMSTLKTNVENPYGDACTAQKIVDTLLFCLK